MGQAKQVKQAAVRKVLGKQPQPQKKQS